MEFDIEAARQSLRNREIKRRLHLDSLFERAVADFEKIVLDLNGSQSSELGAFVSFLIDLNAN